MAAETPKPKAVLVQFAAVTPEVQADADRATKGFQRSLEQLGFSVELLDRAKAETLAAESGRADEPLQYYEVGKGLKTDLILWGRVGPETEELRKREEMLKELGKPDSRRKGEVRSIFVHSFDFRTGGGMFCLGLVDSHLLDPERDHFIRDLALSAGFSARGADLLARLRAPTLEESDAIRREYPWQLGWAGVKFKPGTLDVAEVPQFSPAERSGLRRGDVIESVDGEKVGNFQDWWTQIRNKKPGDSVAIGFRRGHQGHTASLTFVVSQEREDGKRRRMLNAPALDFGANALDGKTFSLSDLRGKVVLLDFWFIGCEGCRYAFPTLLYCHERFESDGLVVVGISHDREKDKLSEFVSQNRLPWLQVWDGKEGDEFRRLGKLYEIDQWPTTILIDRKGVIRAMNLHGAELVRAVRHWLEQP